jgi:hypothetical protein
MPSFLTPTSQATSRAELICRQLVHRVDEKFGLLVTFWGLARCTQHPGLFQKKNP